MLSDVDGRRLGSRRDSKIEDRVCSEGERLVFD